VGIAPLHRFARFARFNLVGGAGLAVQLLTLAALTHAAGWHYLPATAVAVGTTLLHNFAWHARWTWRDRRIRGRRAIRAFVLFVSGNGVVSMLGNLALMPVLVDVAGLTAVPANVVAVAICGLLNYWLSDRVSFGRARVATEES
jgi:putative flippase GtrA